MEPRGQLDRAAGYLQPLLMPRSTAFETMRHIVLLGAGIKSPNPRAMRALPAILPGQPDALL